MSSPYPSIETAFDAFLKDLDSKGNQIDIVQVGRLRTAFYAGAEQAFELEASCKRGVPFLEEKIRWLHSIGKYFGRTG